MGQSLKELFQSSKFIHGIELVTTRGQLQPEGEHTSKLAHDLMDTKIFNFISITDNAGGNPQIAAESMGRSLLEKGHNVNIHLTCKDRNRNAIEMRAWQLASEGFNNILALSGDYPVAGYEGVSRPVFDIDSVVMIKMLTDMNQGLTVPGRKPGSSIEMSKTNFFVGGCVSPFKKLEGEYLTQLFKFEKKVKAGMDYINPQLGYDSRKWAELLSYMKLKNIKVPILANIYVLSKFVGRLFNQGFIPGCNVSKKLYQLICKQAESKDKGQKFFLEFAAKQAAVAKGLGFQGVYYGGIHKLETIHKIKEIEKAFQPDDWKEFYKETQFPLKNEYYLFQTDKEGLPTQEFVPKYHQSKKIMNRFAKRIFVTPPVYRLSRIMHKIVFEPKSPIYHLMRLWYRIINGKKPLEKFSHFFEHLGKITLFGCHDCGDCSLLDIAYLCPESKCSKNQRNGPCGGSFLGQCELKDKKCIWLKAYKRLKLYNEERENCDKGIIITNADLLYTSGWQNYFLKRDHITKFKK